MGVRVVIHEMRPAVGTFAHRTGLFAEMVCSNSFRSDDDERNAVGLLHWEMRAAQGLVMEMATRHRLPAGGALAVGRVGSGRAGWLGGAGGAGANRGSTAGGGAVLA